MERDASSGGSIVAHGGVAVRVPPKKLTPRVARRDQLMAAARVSASVAMRAWPRTRARRPPQERRTKWAILGSALGRVPV